MYILKLPHKPIAIANEYEFTSGRYIKKYFLCYIILINAHQIDCAPGTEMFPTAVPWYMFIAFYVFLGTIYVVFGVTNRVKLFKLILKCIPIISLFFHVLSSLVLLSWSRNEEETQDHLSNEGSENEVVMKTQTFLWGLAFSCIGDACLVVPKIAAFGVLSFAIAVTTYIKLFGFSLTILFSLNIGGVLLGVPVFAILVGMVAILLKQDLRRRLNNFLLFVLIAYFCLISFMVWCSFLNVQRHGDTASVLGALGAFLFFISDISIALSALLGTQFMLFQGRVLIMVTYYGAQLFIALSV